LGNTSAQFTLRTPWITLTLVLCVAFGLRIAGIVQQSIWYDEGLSIYYARGSVGDLWRGISESEHPPLHSLLLHAWMTLCGDGELSVRFLSVWWGTLSVALAYRLGRQLSRANGTLTALFLTLSPLAIWFSQETRGYAMAVALVMATVDVAWELVLSQRKPPRGSTNRRWTPYVFYVVLATAALYTHLYSAFVLVALNLAWAIQQILASRDKREWRPWLFWGGAQLAVLVLFAPWLPHVSAQWQLNATYYHGAVDWKQIVRRTLVAFSAGRTLEGRWATMAAWTLSGLAGLGTVALLHRPRNRPQQNRRRQDGRALLVLWPWMLVPVLVQIALNRSLPKFAPRYLLNALPPFLLLAARGILWLAEQLSRTGVRSETLISSVERWLATLALLLSTALLGGATTRSLANHYLNGSLYRPDVRSTASYIEKHATDQDLIVLLGGHNYPAFSYYYKGALPILSLPDRLLPDTRAPVDIRALEQLDRAIARRRQLWLVLWQEHLADPTGLIVDELEQTYHRLGVGRTFHDIGLLLFDVSTGPRLTQNAIPSVLLQTEVGGQVRLQGYDLPRHTVQPSGTLYLYLYWEAIGQVKHDYKVFTQILDKRGNIVAQHDKIAGAESYPTSHWPPGALVRDRFMLTVRSDAPPGQYTLIAGLYRPGGSMPRLPVSGPGAQGDHIVLATIEVQGD
jgi:4-amino-4-deoxy-L-arabinose transferase-like glycosyltransferase